MRRLFLVLVAALLVGSLLSAVSTSAQPVAQQAEVAVELRRARLEAGEAQVLGEPPAKGANGAKGEKKRRRIPGNHRVMTKLFALAH